jgi:hypothetical protein
LRKQCHGSRRSTVVSLQSTAAICWAEGSLFSVDRESLTVDR